MASVSFLQALAMIASSIGVYAARVFHSLDCKAVVFTMLENCQHSNEVLVGILRVLERIEEKLERQDKRFEHLEDVTAAETDSLARRPESGKPAEHVETNNNSLNTSKELSYSHSHPKSTGQVSNQSIFQVASSFDVSPPSRLEDSRIPYGSWSFNERCQELEKPFKEMLDKYLGDYWRIPNDGRLPLTLFHGSTQGTRDYWDTQGPRNRNIGNKLDFLHRFDANLKSHNGNDFIVIDIDLANNTRLYRLGEKAIGNELRVESGSNQAPWSRLILYQGMTTGESFNPQESSHLQNETSGPVPYFGKGDGSIGLWTHIYSHLQLKRRKITMNPYLDCNLGFHTTFYEIRESEHLQIKELWKHGPLYDHPLGYSFRKSAYTLYVPASGKINDDNLDNSSKYWTILLLAPDHFYNENNASFPITQMDPGRAQALGHCLGKLNRHGAEMNIIGQGLERISERWSEFQSFFDFILDGGDSLMNPDEHDRLLFDDGAFSRSRRYFWAIDCLSEFELSISDNITQWELYKTARVLPVVTALSELDFLQFKNAERQCNILLNQREYFRQKLASTKALRDALFSASAVIESRASTRLGENVKLLTYVSIFFLPLAFCTSLWSINDKFSSTALVAVIIIVALATYITMFNVNSLVYNFSRLYDIKKRRVVKIMKTDDGEVWKQRGKKFEEFRPKHENPAPSEWYIPLYTLLNPLVMLGVRRKREDKKDRAELKNSSWASKRFGVTSWFKKMPKQKEEETRDEAWVF